MRRYRDYVQEGLSAGAHDPIGNAFVQDLKPRHGHFPARARAMVHFMQNGGPSQMDLFDPKPELQKRSGQSIPASVEIYQKGNSARPEFAAGPTRASGGRARQPELPRRVEPCALAPVPR
jgi:hypothetical protein